MTHYAWPLLLIRELPASGAERSRVWRVLKAIGAAVLHDGVHLLPRIETMFPVIDLLYAGFQRERKGGDDA